MESASAQTDESDSGRSVEIGGGVEISYLEVDFDGLYQEWLDNSGKAINQDEYNQASDSPWASPDNVRPIRWIEQRTTRTNGQGVSGQPGQENAGISIGEHPIVFEQSKFGERASKTDGKEMEVSRKGSPLIR